MKTEQDKMIFLINALKKRTEIINTIYKYELFDQKVDSKQIFEDDNLDDNAIKIIEQIEAKYDSLKKIIIAALSADWEWERLQPLVRAILLYGTYELFLNNPKIVINEMINITKIYIPGTVYKLVNKALDLIASKLVDKK
ncbi:transcription antitermination factor NusB [Metamycoplasma salivarium]|uniref:Transcription termination factor n=2 Tax=Metamycoplasma salivarium TaxID=2124 RepID=A0A448ZZJ2_METSV|nr:transcription antitermination factor NusB [Metamycoplasma salivarium]CAD7361447.1 transcription termination factor [Metamycoplasma salivarium]VEU56643.1 transcription termination factor [Metamycoplasma salivarium]